MFLLLFRLDFLCFFACVAVLTAGPGTGAPSVFGSERRECFRTERRATIAYLVPPARQQLGTKDSGTGMFREGKGILVLSTLRIEFQQPCEVLCVVHC